MSRLWGSVLFVAILGLLAYIFFGQNTTGHGSSGDRKDDSFKTLKIQ